jgi:hypothetical protein
MYRNILGRFDANADLISLDAYDRDSHVGSDFDGLAATSCQYQHVASLSISRPLPDERPPETQ